MAEMPSPIVSFGALRFQTNYRRPNSSIDAYTPYTPYTPRTHGLHLGSTTPGASPFDNQYACLARGRR